MLHRLWQIFKKQDDWPPRKTYFIDLDGTIFRCGTNDLLPGAKSLLDRLVMEGAQIVFTTCRGDRQFRGHPIYSRAGAIDGVRSLQIPFKTIIFDVESPRIVINDGGAAAINRPSNRGWTASEIGRAIRVR